MAQKKKKKNGKGSANTDHAKSQNQMPASTPWISMRSGLRVIAVTSVIMAVLTTIQASQLGKGWLESILLGLLFGGLIWAIFYGYLWFNRVIRR